MVNEAAELEARNVTPQAEAGLVDDEHLQVLRCVCGEALESVAIGLDPTLVKPMPCCGARLVFAQVVTVFELIDAGGTITQPSDQHPIWSSEVQKVGPVTITLRHLQESMLEQGGTFAIHSYSGDGNPLIDATTADGATLDELLAGDQ